MVSPQLFPLLKGGFQLLWALFIRPEFDREEMSVSLA
jgi:hypothetical protein